MWPDAKLETVTKLRDAGLKIFREMINCHRGTAKQVLDDAYRRIGITPSHGISGFSVDREQELLEAADYIFCSNVMAEQSMVDHGIEGKKILSASYGWDPQRFSGQHRLLPPSDGITFVFVGSICVRKGCHLLLEYWTRSKVKGQLVLAGEIEPVIRTRFSTLLDREDVIVLDFVDDIGALYRSADVFVFASLEEGGLRSPMKHVAVDYLRSRPRWARAGLFATALRDLFSIHMIGPAGWQPSMPWPVMQISARGWGDLPNSVRSCFAGMRSPSDGSARSCNALREK
ncbi:glycosyltransferase [Rhodopseudomonas sp. P2A-2r]|nr:glycosyltransferase [Rhodopseudomonas sp. P2A-2r]UZE48030.1 glycosyltransferase [Rhodopseudomonas sp. P2A-2r]